MEVAAFAREHKVSEWAVRSDLLLLRGMGQDVHGETDQPPGRVRLGRRFQDYPFYSYASGERPLFTSNEPSSDH